MTDEERKQSLTATLRILFDGLPDEVLAACVADALGPGVRAPHFVFHLANATAISIGATLMPDDILEEIQGDWYDTPQMFVGSMEQLKRYVLNANWNTSDEVASVRDNLVEILQRDGLIVDAPTIGEIDPDA